MAVSSLTQVFIQGAIEGYTDLIAPLAAFSYAVEQDSAVLNDQIIVPFVNGAASASAAFTYASGYSGDNANVQGKTVTMNTLLYQPLKLTDADMGKLNPEVVARLGRQAGAKLASDVVSASFASVVSITNFAATCSADAPQFTSSLSALAALDRSANNLKWPDQGRFIIANTTLWANLMGNSSLNSYLNYGNASVVQAGKLPEVMGFTPFKVTVPLPTVFNTGSLSGFASTQNAIAFGNGYHAPGPDASTVVEAVRAVDEKTGLVIGYRKFYDPAKATTVQIIESLSGCAVADSSALIHIKSTSGTN